MAEAAPIPGAAQQPTRTVLGRFALEAACAGGGQGTVWRARDRVTGGVAAVKVLPGLASDALASLRREVAALRLLRIPGVVPLLDAGAEDGLGLVAMQWVDGRPLTAAFESARRGAEGEARWTALAPTVIGLLETLGRVHAAGIVHRDLKPANIVVDERGLPTLVDLGIASGVALDARGAAPLAGTPRYMAPALFDGTPPSAATDLFALAVVVYEALTGKLPRPDDLGAIVAGEGLSRSQLLGTLSRVAPLPVAETLTEVLAGEGRGTQTAEDLLRALGAADPAPLGALAATLQGVLEAHGGALAGPEPLVALFRAEERIVGHASAAARILFEGCSGRDPAALLDELARWLAQGIGRVRLGRLVLEELDVERLERRRMQRSLLSQRDLTHTWVTTGIVGLTEQTLREARARSTRGEFREALAELPTLASVVVQIGRGDLVAEVLEDWLFAALGAADRNALALLLHEVDRSDLSGTHGVQVAAIATAALATLDGATARARERLGCVGPGDRFTAARAWHAVQVFAARRDGDQDALEAAVAAARAWAATQAAPVPELETFRGWAAFRAGDYDGALARHRAAADAYAPAGNSRRASALLDAGAAALEAGQPEEALELAREAARLMRAMRHPFAQGRIEWLLRAATYRLGRASRVDRELVRAAPSIGAPHLTGLVLLTEAAVGWRAGDPDAAALARAAARAAEAAGLSADASLAAGLAAAASGNAAGDFPGAGAPPSRHLLQTAALWCGAGGALAPDDRTTVEATWSTLTRFDLLSDRRWEVLAPSECRALLGHSTG